MATRLAAALVLVALAHATGRTHVLTEAHKQWFLQGGSPAVSCTTDASDLLPVEVVDWSQGSPAARGRALARALQNGGYAHISNHGVDTGVIERAWDHSARFFEASKDPGAFGDIAAVERQELEKVPLKTQRGYSDLGAEALNPYLGQDQKKSFDYGLAVKSTPDGEEATHLGPNRWPAEGGQPGQAAPGFRAAATSYLDEVYPFSREVLSGLALGLGLEASAFDAPFEKPLVVNRYLLYPPQPNASAVGAEDLSMGAGSHVDYGALTIIYQRDAGLEVLDGATQQWRRSNPIDGTLVVGTGYMMEKLSNGVLPAPKHRVVNRSPTDRMSFAFFLDPNPAARISPMESFVTEEQPAAFEPHIAGHKGVIFAVSQLLQHVRKIS